MVLLVWAKYLQQHQLLLHFLKESTTSLLELEFLLGEGTWSVIQYVYKPCLIIILSSRRIIKLKSDFTFWCAILWGFMFRNHPSKETYNSSSSRAWKVSLTAVEEIFHKHSLLGTMKHNWKSTPAAGGCEWGRWIRIGSTQRATTLTNSESIIRSAFSAKPDWLTVTVRDQVLRLNVHPTWLSNQFISTTACLPVFCRATDDRAIHWTLPAGLGRDYPPLIRMEFRRKNYFLFQCYFQSDKVQSILMENYRIVFICDLRFDFRRKKIGTDIVPK